PDKEKPSVLVLGMGTGTWAMMVRDYFPECEITGVEIDEDITELAHRYFELDEDIPVYTYDGRAFLQAMDEKYDCIMVDAYRDITIPFSMSSVEFFTLVRDHLNPGGVMVVNMNMHSDEEGGINQQLSDTIASVFDCVMTADVPGSTNRELFAGGAGVTGEAFAEALAGYEKTLPEEGETASQEQLLAYSLWRVSDRLQPYQSSGYLLTDDKAPVELLGMQVIDALIRDEIGYYKDVFQRDGLEGLLDAM
nr:fused MFS/spermidine synthase [Lachnospiraceae bacterium]